jgi:TatD DNase family protein
VGRILAVCLSEAKGTPKQCRGEALLREDHGLVGDAHAGSGHRQVSLLPAERIDEFCRAGADVSFGDFGENLVTEGIDFAALAAGDRLRAGGAVLEITQFGKECHSRCRIFETMGDCIMPRHGVFAKVVRGGAVSVGSALEAAGKGEADV